MPNDVSLCLIGEGIAASPSRAMQEGALAATGRSGSYEIVDISAPQLPAVLRDLRAGRWRGANVTIPYKQALAPACDELGPDAAATGAVNTLTVEADGRLIGDNTDAAGFELGLSTHRLWPLPGASAVVVGAGGAAAAVVLALSRAPVRRTTVVARRINVARALVDRLGAAGIGDLTIALWDEDYLGPTLAQADIVVNATPGALADMPFIPASLPASCTVADVRYRPRPVDLVVAAHDAGLRACDGVEMLLQQGMLSFRRWTDDEPPYDAARTALYGALGK